MMKSLGGTRNVIKILHNHIVTHNPFVARWKRRGAPKPNPVGKRSPGNFGDVEYACFEAWYQARLDGDEHAQNDAIKQAMNDEESRKAAAASAAGV